MSTTERQVVHRVEEGMDRQDIAATTYQMRNFYRQLQDGFFSRLDVFNYASHHQIAKWAQAAKGDVLDVCCGRGLLLPLLRYHAKDIRSYTGLDIAPSNATWLMKRVTDGKPLVELQGARERASSTDEGARAAYYPWPTYFVEGNVARADELVREQRDASERGFDFIVYTASIEHMHPDDGRASLRALRNLAREGAELVLTCPNTPEDQDGYDTKYRAHVYEWKLSELREALTDAGWHVADVWSVDASISTVQEWADTLPTGFGADVRRIRKYVPQEWIGPALAPLVPPELSDEVGLRCCATAVTAELF